MNRTFYKLSLFVIIFCILVVLLKQEDSLYGRGRRSDLDASRSEQKVSRLPRTADVGEGGERKGEESIVAFADDNLFFVGTLPL